MISEFQKKKEEHEEEEEGTKLHLHTDIFFSLEWIGGSAHQKQQNCAKNHNISGHCGSSIASQSARPLVWLSVYALLCTHNMCSLALIYGWKPTTTTTIDDPGFRIIARDFCSIPFLSNVFTKHIIFQLFQHWSPRTFVAHSVRCFFFRRFFSSDVFFFAFFLIMYAFLIAMVSIFAICCCRFDACMYVSLQKYAV